MRKIRSRRGILEVDAADAADVVDAMFSQTRTTVTVVLICRTSTFSLDFASFSVLSPIAYTEMIMALYRRFTYLLTTLAYWRWPVTLRLARKALADGHPI